MREEELMEVDGGSPKWKLVKKIVQIIVEGVVYDLVKYTVKKISDSTNSSSGSVPDRPNPSCPSL